MKTSFRFTLIACLTLIILTVLQLSAQVPMLLEYDGFLEVKGKPVNGSQTMQVKIYDAPKGGKVLYTENVGKVNVTKGEFYFTYGGVGAGIAAALQGSQHWLAVVVNNKEQSPRMRLLPVPFALRSADAQTLSAQVGTLSTSVSAAQVQSSTLSANITALHAQSTALSSNLTAVNAKINSLSANVSSLQAGSGGTPDSAALADLLSRARGISLTGNLTFQEVPVGEFNFQDFTIRNKGFDRLVVSGIQFPSGFSGDWTSGTIAPLSDQNVRVSFSPVSASAYGGNITVNSDATQGVAFITIAGTGIMPVAGWVTTLAGSFDQGYADGIRAAASFNEPNGVAVDSSGNVYVADSSRIRKILGPEQ